MIWARHKMAGQRVSGRLGSFAKSYVNRAVERFNLRVETLTARRVEDARLTALKDRGQFDKPVFPLLPGFQECDVSVMGEALRRYQADIARMEWPATNSVGYFVDNDYCTSPDMEVYYSLIRITKPQVILEVGSGFSTQVARQAICDGGLKAQIISIDPHPRTDIDIVCDVVVRSPLEDGNVDAHVRALTTNDILYVDSSHELRCGNDVLRIVFEMLPLIRSGVLVHFHDVFLPYDYPWDFMFSQRVNWAEQYLLQAVLQYGDGFDVVWPGYYVQRTRQNFAQEFPTLRNGRAQSLWLRKR